MSQPILSNTGDNKGAIARLFEPVPLLGFLLGFLVCVLLEKAIGTQLALLLGLPKMPVLFGLVTIFKVIAGIVNTVFKGALFEWATLIRIPMAVLYFGLIYVLPVVVVARLMSGVSNTVSWGLHKTSVLISALVHLALIYLICHIWSGMSDYRLITLKLMFVAILLSLSLNIINGYMGEFSCSHPGFMAIGAYMASLFTEGIFMNDKVF